MTGEDYIESSRDDREGYRCGERVKDVTSHPAFRSPAAMIARPHTAPYGPTRSAVLVASTNNGSDGCTHRFFTAPQGVDDLIADQKALADRARMTYGWMVQSPEYTGARKRQFALTAIAIEVLGATPICRPSYSAKSVLIGSHVDRLLSSRIDENDTILALEKVPIPWENVFIHGSLSKVQRFTFHGSTHPAVKRKFIAGLLTTAISQQSSGPIGQHKAFADACLAEYYQDGRTVPGSGSFEHLREAMGEAPNSQPSAAGIRRPPNGYPREGA
jgi:aromatic ring hydroxylase